MSEKKAKAKRRSQKPRYDYKVWMADYETSTDKWVKIKGYTEPWAFGITEVPINSDKPIDFDTHPVKILSQPGVKFNVIEFFENCTELDDGDIVYFHNLKFDCNFLGTALLERGYDEQTLYDSQLRKTGRRYKLNDGEIKILATGSTIYNIEAVFNGRHITFRDSLKRIPMPVEAMPREYGMPILKGDIDYDRDPDLPISEKESYYLCHDVLIPAEVLRQQYREGFKEQTCASYAYNCYRKWLKSRGLDIKELFPILTREEDMFCRTAYDGGEVYVNPDYVGKLLGNIFDKCLKEAKAVPCPRPCYTWDVNSMFTAVYSCMPMPVGKPHITTEVQEIGLDEPKLREWRGDTKRYFIEVRNLQCHLKPGRVPSIGITNGFGSRAYPKDVRIPCTVFVDIRWEMVLMDYEIESVSFGRCLWFNTRQDLFFDYVQDIVREKNEANVAGNKMRKNLSKVKLNSLYGKFGQNMVCDNVGFAYDEETGVLNREHFVSEGPGKYVPIAAVITAEARFLLISQANKFGYDADAYMDTDSIHVLDGIEIDGKTITHNVKPWRRRPLPEDKTEKAAQIEDTLTREQQYALIREFEYGRPNEVWCDEYDLGAFKIEANFACAKYLRAKTYFEASPATDEEVEVLRSKIENRGFVGDVYDKNMDWNGEDYIIPGNGYNLIGCIKGAGIPSEAKHGITVDNFEIGLVLHGKLAPKRVRGGCVLVPTDYEIRADRTVSTLAMEEQV